MIDPRVTGSLQSNAARSTERLYHRSLGSYAGGVVSDPDPHARVHTAPPQWTPEVRHSLQFVIMEKEH